MIVRNNINLPTWDEIVNTAPDEIRDYLEKCKDAFQDPKWHPEGNTYIHVRLVFDRAREFGDIDLMMAAIFHDLGKVDVTEIGKKGSWVAYGHEHVSTKIAERYKDWISEMGANPEAVIQIVNQHMRMHIYDDMKSSKQKSMAELEYFNKIAKFSTFDKMDNLTKDEFNRYKHFKQEGEE